MAGIQGYFVRRNIHVGKRAKGGYTCELGIVGFRPQTQHFVHIEPSMDAQTWPVRESRYKKKFEAGRKYIPELFQGVEVPTKIEQIALFSLGAGKTDRTVLADGRGMMMPELLAAIMAEPKNKRIEREAIPEQYPLLRTIRFICQYGLKP